MKLLNRILLTYFAPLLRQLEAGSKDSTASQRNTFRMLMQHVDQTQFAQQHRLSRATSYEAFRRQVPVREYDDLQPYIERIRQGEKYILWDEDVRWFAKSSGTSSDKSKYIPITPHNLKHCHYRGFQLMMASYLDRHPDSGIMTGKALTLGGSVAPDRMTNGQAGTAFTGDLSAILLKNSPKIVEWVRTPAKNTALIAGFDEKVERICKECSKENVTNFSGVPSWNLLLLQRIVEYNHKQHLLEVWPNLELFMHGGTHFDPYREQFKALIPTDRMNYLENYNASEGYFAFQDDLQQNGMRLALDNGVFYEFIPVGEVDRVLKGECDRVIPLSEVRTGQDYALVISTDSGLWRYLIGDTVQFVSIHPHKILITGRTKLFINAFGEELMIANAENALAEVCRATGALVSEYTVAPVFMNQGGKGAHEWVVEFKHLPQQVSPESFAERLDAALCRLNSDYEAKRNGTMQRLILHPVPQGTFYRWMEQRGKIGGQHKVPRLSSHRTFVEELHQLVVD